MKKWLIIISIVSCIILLASCKSAIDTAPPSSESNTSSSETNTSSSETNTSSSQVNTSSPETITSSGINELSPLEFEKNTYKYKEIEISYPQISNINSQLISSISQQIKDDAISVLDGWYSGELDDLSVEISYTYELINEKILSICFEGLSYYKGAAYPSNHFYTSNIDISTGERLTAKDLLEINIGLIESIKKNAKYVNGDTNKELISAAKQELEGYNATDMLADIENSVTTGSNIYFYLKQPSLGISLPVVHALGDYMNFEVNYNHLTPYLKRNVKSDSH